MADASARFVLIGEDRTSRAFASVDRSIRTTARSAMQFRNILSGFGVVFSVRAFSNWVKDALELHKLTAAQAKDLREARAAMAGLNVEFQGLARTAATELAPALERAARFWREFLFPTQVEAASERIDELNNMIGATIDRIERLKKQDITNLGVLRQIDSSAKALQAYRAELEQLRDIAFKPAPAGTFLDGLSEMTAGVRLPAEFRKDFDFAAASAAILNSELKEMSGTVAALPADFKKLSPEFNTFAAALRNSSSELSEMQKLGKELAGSLGRGLKDSFVDAFMGIEVSWKDTLRRMALEAAFSGLFNFLGGQFAGSTSGVGKFLGNFFGGSRASGGSVRGGMMYKVHPGEAFFTPGQDGHVGKTGGGMQIGTIAVDARGATDPAAVEAAVERGVLAAVSIADERTNAKFRAYGRPAMA